MSRQQPAGSFAAGGTPTISTLAGSAGSSSNRLLTAAIPWCLVLLAALLILMKAD